ncbi:MAG: universal stress protein [Candidatus Dormibacteraceae bacterium]
MYSRIYVPVDNSEHSNAAIAMAVEMARRTRAGLIGCHVYAARMHDVRFKQMEYTLPDEYQQEQELERQRKIHDSLITRGLQLISDSYLEVMKTACDEAGLPVEYKTFDGKNWECLVQDIAESDYDLVVMGAVGTGAVRDSQIGSVTDRVTRRTRTDCLVVRNVRPFADGASDRIVVGVDGSPQGFAGLRTAIELARTFDKRVEAVAVYDPYLHYALFNGIVDVLSAEASKVFRFKEQEQLHEEIIDTGLAKIYDSHLKVATSIARQEGVELKTTLLDGKVFKKVLQYVREDPPWLLIVGRIGVHSAADMDMGSHTDNLLRLAPCSLLLSSRSYVPPLDLQAETSVTWTEEAEARMEKVPTYFRGIARTAVCRFAMERGHSVISSGVIDQAIGDIMPAHAARAMGVESTASFPQSMEEAARTRTWICRRCGRAARDVEPERCPVCGESAFTLVDKESIAALAAAEGGLEEERAFDGFKVRWTVEGKEALRVVPKGYEWRRVKARIEKLARVQRLPSITRDFVEANLEDAYGPVNVALTTAGTETSVPVAAGADAGAGQDTGAGEGRPAPAWTDEAGARLNQVPSGFMRVLAKAKVEEFALKIHADRVTLDVVAGGLAEARNLMQSMVKAYGPGAAEAARRFHGAEIPSPDESSPGWTEDGVRKLNEIEVKASEKFDPARARELAEHAAESIAARSEEAINARFLEKIGLRLGYGHPLSSKTYEHSFSWTPEAEARLQEVPSFCREMARWRVEWTAAKQGLGDVITPETMDAKYGMWAEVSEQIQAGGRTLEWEAGAEERIGRVPEFVRGQVIQSVEGNAREMGLDRVSTQVLDRVIEKWIATGDFHEGRFGFKAGRRHVAADPS